MSDDLDTDVADQPDDHNIRQLREKAKRADEADARAAQAERELAFAKAGIPLNDPRSSYFQAGYQDEMTPEKIKSTWDSTFGPQDASPPPIPASEVEAHQRIASAADGAAPPPPMSHDDELTAKVRSGDLKSADDIAHFLHQRTPDMVSWDGPADASFAPLR